MIKGHESILQGVRLNESKPGLVSPLNPSVCGFSASRYRFYFLALLSFDVKDPGWSYQAISHVNNAVGPVGAFVSIGCCLGSAIRHSKCLAPRSGCSVDRQGTKMDESGSHPWV